MAWKMFRQGLLVTLLCSPSWGTDLGRSPATTDIGDVGRKTLVTYDRSSGIFFISAAGENIWGERDAFGFVSKEMKGDASIGARIRFMGKSAQPHRKAGVMLRQSLTPDSVYADVVIHGDGLTSLQYRAATGGPTREIQCAQETPTAVRLEKRGDYLQVFTANEDGAFGGTGCLIKLALRGTFHAGLAVSAHDNAAFENARFSSVTVGMPPERRAARVSAIEIVPVDSLSRRVLWYSTSTLEVPSFTADGKAICFREGGQLQRLTTTGRAEPSPVGMENIEDCAAAQPLISAAQRVTGRVDGGRAEIRLESADGKAKRLVNDNRHQWSPRLAPDAKSFAFLSGAAKPEKGKQPAADYLLMQRTLEGGENRLLAEFHGGQGSLGISPWSPDGKSIVFVSREPD